MDAEDLIAATFAIGVVVATEAAVELDAQKTIDVTTLDSRFRTFRGRTK